MSENKITISILGASGIAEDVAIQLEGHDYSEVENNEVTGAEGELSWLIAAVLGSPVVSKVLDLLESSMARKKISKVTVSKDGKVEIEGASPEEAAQILRSLNDQTDDSEDV